MVALPEVDQLDQQVAKQHDVAGLQVQVNDTVLAEVADCLHGVEHQEEFGLEASGGVVVDKISQVTEGQVVHQQAVRKGVFLVHRNVVLRQEVRVPILYHLQDPQLVLVAAAPLSLPLDGHQAVHEGLLAAAVLLADGHVLVALRRVDEPEQQFSGVNGRKAALTDLVDLPTAGPDRLLHIDVVKNGG